MDSPERWIFRATQGEWVSLGVLIGLQILYGALVVLYAVPLKGMVDAASEGDGSGFWLQLCVAGVVILAHLLIRAVIRHLDELTRARVENGLKVRLFHTLLCGDYGRVAAVHSGEWMNRLTSDVRVVADGVTDVLPGFAGTLSRLVGALAMVFWLDARLVVVLVPGGVALALLTFVFRRTLKGLHLRVQEADGRLRVFLQEGLAGLLTVQAFSAEKQLEERAVRFADDHLDARMRRMQFSNLCNFGFGVAMSGASLLGAGWCAYGILIGSLSYGTLVAMMQAISQVRAPFATISGYLPTWHAAMASAERLQEADSLCKEEESAKNADEVAAFYNCLAELRLDDVSYTHWPSAAGVTRLSREGAHESVANLSLVVKRGEFLALIGDSGCGKTTALRLLMGAYEPDAGERNAVLYDGSVVRLDASLRRLFAYVPQGNQLMRGSIRDVITLGRDDVPDAKVWESLRIACADEFVRELPDGLGSVLGERGAGLSEGQMQRIAVARAVCSRNPVLLLDEATSALDASTEERLLRNLRRLSGQTVVIVTHRNAALELCDRIVRIPEGEVECRHE